MDQDKSQFELGKIEKALLAVVVIALLAAGFYAWWSGENKERSINSFQECVAAGNPIMESYPEQCSANGQTFTNPDQALSSENS